MQITMQPMKSMEGLIRQTAPVKISTLSPVHMGCGEVYEPTSYVIEDQTLYGLDYRSFAQALSSAELNRLIDENARPDQLILGLQGEIYRHREALIPWATHTVAVKDGVAEQYKKRIDQAAQREERGRRVINQMHIDRQVYNAHNQMPILPGSGIKGAIRTALLDQLNAGQQTTHRKGSDLEKALLNFRKVEEDPLRLLKVSDASYHHLEGIAAAEICFSVMHKRNDWKSKVLGTRLECVAEGRSRAFDSALTLLNTQRPGQNTPFQDVTQLASVCNRYYRHLLATELQGMEPRGLLQADWLKNLRQLLDGELGTALDNNQAFLLRLGRYGSAEGKTLNGVRNIKIRTPKGMDDRHDDHATSWWLAGNTEKATRNLLPFGWVLVELDPDTNTLSETHAFLRQLAEPAYQFQAKDRRRRQEHQAMLEQQQLAEQAREAERQAAEKAEQEAAAKLAALSPEQRKIEALKTRMTNGEDRNAGNSGQLAGDLGKLIDSASQWSKADKALLLSLATALYQHLGVNTKKNRKVKEKLRKICE